MWWKILFGIAGLYILAACTAGVVGDRVLYYPPKDKAKPFAGFQEVYLDHPALTYPVLTWVSPAKPTCPTVVFFHGNATHLKNQQYRFDHLTEKGIGVIAPAWPGYSGSQGTPSEANLHLAAKAAYDYATAQDINPNQLIIHGNSLGTGPAAKLASENDIGALILEAPYYSMLSLVQAKARILPVSWMLDDTYRTDLWIENVNAPIMIAHGTKDRVIPQYHSKKLWDLIESDKNKYQSFEGGSHFSLTADGLYDKIHPFLAQQNITCTE